MYLLQPQGIIKVRNDMLMNVFADATNKTPLSKQSSTLLAKGDAVKYMTLKVKHCQ